MFNINVQNVNLSMEALMIWLILELECQSLYFNLDGASMESC
jgi:hypothetical protein